VDVLRLTASEYLSSNEIDAATLVREKEINVQRQRRVVWPASPVVARAYLDQLARGNAIGQERGDAVKAALVRVESGAVVRDELRALVTQLEQDMVSVSGLDAVRHRALADSLERLAEKAR
jgi:hypothetical protein